MASILDEEGSPIKNLPRAAGKARKGRPRKTRIDNAATAAAAVAASQLPVQADEVKEAVRQAVTAAIKKDKPPDPISEAGIRAAERAVERSEINKQVRRRLAGDDRTVVSPAVESRVDSVIAERDIKALQEDLARPKPQFWHLLRMR